MSVRLVAVGIAGAGFTLVPGAHANDASEDIASLMSSYDRYRDFSGAVEVSVEGEIVFAGATGLASREWAIPNSVETRFSIASVSKPFTAALALRLVDAGRLRLDDTVSDHVPFYRTDTGTRITVHQLLTHSSGIPNSIGTREFWMGNPCRLDYSRQEFVEQYQSGDLIFKPGTTTLYSDANFTLLALVIESASGMSFHDAMQEWLLAPIGADDSGFMDIFAVQPGMASGYLKSGRQYSISARINYESVQLGAGDMYSTVSDMNRLAQAARSTDLFSQEMVNRMLTTQVEGRGRNWHYGYGWAIQTLALRESGEELQVASAPGNNAGFSALIYMVPEQEIAVSIIQNTGPGFLDMELYTIAREIVHILFGEPVLVPPLSLADELGAVVRDEGIDSARSSYLEWAQDSNEFDPDTRRMNVLGYQLLAEGLVKEAVAIFELNIRSSPEDANSLDSFGEGLLAAGRIEEGIRAYRRSLELNPVNDNARRIVDEHDTRSDR